MLLLDQSVMDDLMHKIVYNYIYNLNKYFIAYLYVYQKHFRIFI